MSEHILGTRWCSSSFCLIPHNSFRAHILCWCTVGSSGGLGVHCYEVEASGLEFRQSDLTVCPFNHYAKLPTMYICIIDFQNQRAWDMYVSCSLSFFSFYRRDKSLEEDHSRSSVSWCSKLRSQSLPSSLGHNTQYPQFKVGKIYFGSHLQFIELSPRQDGKADEMLLMSRGRRSRDRMN